MSPDPVCAACGHKVILKGEPNTSQYYQCVNNCRCLIQGCIAYDPKYEVLQWGNVDSVEADEQ